MSKTDFSIALRNYAGVPVVELVGEINAATISALNDILGKLVQAGHYDVMVNLKRAAGQDSALLKSLDKVGKLMRTHYGNLNVIAETKQIMGLSSAGAVGKAVKFCTSEGQALTRIRRLHAASVGGVTPMAAHLSES